MATGMYTHTCMYTHVHVHTRQLSTPSLDRSKRSRGILERA